MSDTQPGDLSVVALGLRQDVSNLNVSILALAKKAHRNRVLIVGLAISVFLDIMLSVGFFIAINAVDHAQKASARANNAARTACVANNEASTRQIQLWTDLFKIPPAPHQAKADPKQVKAFKDILARTFVIQDCSKIR